MNKKLFHGLFIDGKLTLAGGGLLLIAGIFTIYLSFAFLPGAILKVLGASTGLAMAAVAGFGGRAQGLGIKPFTNDPLGWRKAKKSYKAQEDSEN
jgi:hypothetical protein